MTLLWILALTPLPHQPRHRVLRALLTRRRQEHQRDITHWASSVCLENLAVRDGRTCLQCLALPHLLAGYPWSPSGSFLGASREEWGQLGCPAKCPLLCFSVFNAQSLLYISVYNFCHLWSPRYFSSPVSSLPLSSLCACCFKNFLVRFICFVLASVGDGCFPYLYWNKKQTPTTKQKKQTQNHGDRGQKWITLEGYKTRKNTIMFSWYIFPNIILS